MNNDVAYQNCITAAKSIVSIIQLWRKSFGSCRFLIIAYSVYAAATIFILRWDREQTQSLHDYLQVCHDFLTEVSKTCPAIKAPADIVQQHLERDDAALSPENPNTLFAFCNRQYHDTILYDQSNIVYPGSSVQSWLPFTHSGPCAYGGLSILSRKTEPPKSCGTEINTPPQHDYLEFPMVPAGSSSFQPSDFWELEKVDFTQYQSGKI
jgi:hypothetical protein